MRSKTKECLRVGFVVYCDQDMGRLQIKPTSTPMLRKVAFELAPARKPKLQLCSYCPPHRGSVAVLLGFVRSVLRYSDVGGLGFRELGQLGAKPAELQAGHFLVQVFW